MAKSFYESTYYDHNEFQEIVEFQEYSSLRIWNNNSPTNYAPHRHTVLEIIFPIENYYLADVNDTHYCIMPGEILIIPPGMLHALTAPSSGKRLIFLFDISILTKMKSFSSVQSLLVRPLYITRTTYPSIYEDMYSLLVKMQSEYFHANEYAELTIHSLLLQFFVNLGYHHIHMQDLFPNVRPAKQKEYIRKFNQLLNYIEEHYREELDLNTLAEFVGFSKYHFLRLFKQYTGTTLGEYMVLYRIRVAEKLLCNPNLSIADIAVQSGFSSISTFNRLFKQYKKCSPSEYRLHSISPKF